MPCPPRHASAVAELAGGAPGAPLARGGRGRCDQGGPVHSRVLAGWKPMMAQFLKRPITQRTRTEGLPGVTGPARLDRRTKNLTKRLAPGDIAIIDHEDLDRVSADALRHRQVAAVVNAAESISGRYPNHGPQLLVEAGIPVPDLRTRVEGRHVLVVVRGHHHREDLATLRPYIREFKPLMLAVDGGADALLEAGYRPDIIVGDMDSVSDGGLACGAELVVHAYPDGLAPGLARVKNLGLSAVVCPARGTSEDVALLLADEKGASLIVAVGTHNTLDEFLDKC